MFVPSHKLSTLIDSLMGIIIQMSAVTKTPTVSAAMCDLSDAPRTHHERTTSQVKVILAEFTCQSFILWCHFAQVIKHWKHNEGRWCQMWPRKRSRKTSEFQGCSSTDWRVLGIWVIVGFLFYFCVEERSSNL